MRDFYTLTELGRARRLRPMAFAALAHYDLDVRRVTLVTNSTNGIFRIDTTGGEKFVLRISLPGELGHSREQTLSELIFVDALSGDPSVNAPTPLRSRDGELVVTVAVDGVPEPRNCVVFRWLPGGNIGDRMTGQNLERYGELSAHLHWFAGAWTPPADFTLDYVYDTPFPYRDHVRIFNDEYRSLLPDGRHDLFTEAVTRGTALASRLKQSEPARVIHGDLHMWNIMLSRGKLYVFDFEDMLWGWPVQDIGTTLYYLFGEDNFEEMAQSFRQGYERVCPWPEREPGEVNTCMAMRAVNLANYVLADPSPEWQVLQDGYFRRTEGRLRALLYGDDFRIEDYPLTG